MATFLNREKNIEEIQTVLNNARRETILLVPFIRMPGEIFDALKTCNDRGVQIYLICREGTLGKDQRDKLIGLENLNLLVHQNLHAKCYLNEDSAIITSMNLYDRKDERNREMGVLISRDLDNQVYQDALAEIRIIVNASTLEKSSEYVKTNNFLIEMLEPVSNFLKLHQDITNRIFINKKFHLMNNVDEMHPMFECFPYIEDISVYLNGTIKTIEGANILKVKRFAIGVTLRCRKNIRNIRKVRRESARRVR